MVLEVIVKEGRQSLRVRGRRGFENTTFTPIRYGGFGQVVARVGEDGGLLASAQEIAVLRIEANLEHSTHYSLCARTDVVYDPIRGVCAFDDSGSYKKNLAFVCARLPNRSKPLDDFNPAELLKRSDKDVRLLFKRAERDCRVIEIPAGVLEFATDNLNASPEIKAILGRYTNEYGDLLKVHRYNVAQLVLLTPADLKEVGSDRVLVRKIIFDGSGTRELAPIHRLVGKNESDTGQGFGIRERRRYEK